MTPELSRRVGSILGGHLADPAERTRIAQALTQAEVWDDLPGDIRSLLKEIERRPGPGL
jgi:hypothetical protein